MKPTVVLAIAALVVLAQAGGCPLGVMRTLTEFPIPTANIGPAWITAGPDGNIWFTEALYSVTQVARVDL